MRKAAGVVGRQPVARQDLVALEAHQAFDPAGHPLRPRRQIGATDRLIPGALQHRDIVEVVGRDRDLAIVGADPALAHEEPRNTLALGQVLGVVPVVKLVFGRVGDVHRRDQYALGHGISPVIKPLTPRHKGE
jgi:hypothetical protein